MKHKTWTVLLSLLVSAVLLIGGASRFSDRTPEPEKDRIAASFYPIYIAALNLTDGIDHVTVVNLTAEQTGCLHDFTLRPQDMIALNDAAVLLINGGGMESFLETVAEANPALPVVDSSAGIAALTCEDASHDHDHAHDHGHEEINAHYWLSPACYIQQVENLRDGLIARFPADEKQLTENAAKYIEKIQQLQNELTAQMAPYSQVPVMTFHDAFAYLAAECGLHVAASTEVERDTALNAAEIAEIIDTVQESGVEILLAEPQYSPQLAEAIERETHAVAYTLDTAVSGADDPDAYLEAMHNNLTILLQALRR